MSLGYGMDNIINNYMQTLNIVTSVLKLESRFLNSTLFYKKDAYRLLGPIWNTLESKSLPENQTLKSIYVSIQRGKV